MKLLPILILLSRTNIIDNIFENLKEHAYNENEFILKYLNKNFRKIFVYISFESHENLHESFIQDLEHLLFTSQRNKKIGKIFTEFRFNENFSTSIEAIQFLYNDLLRLIRKNKKISSFSTNESRKQDNISFSRFFISNDLFNNSFDFEYTKFIFETIAIEDNQTSEYCINYALLMLEVPMFSSFKIEIGNFEKNIRNFVYQYQEKVKIFARISNIVVFNVKEIYLKISNITCNSVYQLNRPLQEPEFKKLCVYKNYENDDIDILNFKYSFICEKIGISEVNYFNIKKYKFDENFEKQSMYLIRFKSNKITYQFIFIYGDIMYDFNLLHKNSRIYVFKFDFFKKTYDRVVDLNILNRDNVYVCDDFFDNKIKIFDQKINLIFFYENFKTILHAENISLIKMNDIVCLFERLNLSDMTKICKYKIMKPKNYYLNDFFSQYISYFIKNNTFILEKKKFFTFSIKQDKLLDFLEKKFFETNIITNIVEQENNNKYVAKLNLICELNYCFGYEEQQFYVLFYAYRSIIKLIESEKSKMCANIHSWIDKHLLFLSSKIKEDIFVTSYLFFFTQKPTEIYNILFRKCYRDTKISEFINKKLKKESHDNSFSECSLESIGKHTYLALLTSVIASLETEIVENLIKNDIESEIIILWNKNNIIAGKSNIFQNIVNHF